MVTVLKHALRNLKVNCSHWGESDLIQVFTWRAEFASAPEVAICFWDSWPQAPPCHHYASARMQELLPLIWTLMAKHFYYWALLHSSVSGFSVIRGGSPQRHWSISAPSALNRHFPSSSSILLSSFFFYLGLFFSFAHLALLQTRACTHTYFISILLCLTYTHNPSWGAVLRYASLLNHLPRSQGVDHSRRKQYFFFLLVSLNAFLHCAYIDGMDGKSNTCAWVCTSVCLCVGGEWTCPHVSWELTKREGLDK